MPSAPLVSEIPTGLFSDKIGRKQSLILSTIIEAIAIPIVILTHSYLVILVTYFIFGISASFSSGTDTAILYDSLKGLGKEHDFRKINGHLKWLGAWGGAIGGILGGYIAHYQLSYAWWAWFGMLILILLVQSGLTEPQIHNEDDSRNKEQSNILHLRQSFKQAFRGAATYFILYYASVWLFFWLGYSLWQPYLKLIHLPIIYYGVFAAGVSLVSGLSSKASHRLEKIFGMRFSLFLIPIVLSLAFLLESQFVLLFGVLFIGIQALSSGYFSPLLDDYINKKIPSSNRATVLSIKNMVSRLLFIITAPIVGYFIDLYSLQSALFLMGITIIFIALMFFIIFKPEPAMYQENVLNANPLNEG